jgi:hypothetical protein
VKVFELLAHRFPHLIPLSKIDGMTAFSSYNIGILHITIKCKMDVYYVITMPDFRGFMQAARSSSCIKVKNSADHIKCPPKSK